MDITDILYKLRHELLAFQVSTLDHMGLYGTKQDHTGPYRTIRDHTGPYGTTPTTQDHMGPHGTTWDHTEAYGTLWIHEFLNLFSNSVGLMYLP